MADVYREPYAEDYIEPYNLIRSIALYDYIQGGADKSGIFSSLEKVREGVDREEYNREYNRFAEKQRENRLVVLSSEVLGFRNDPHDITYNRVLSDEEVEAYRQDPVAFLERMYAELGNGGIQPSNFYGHSPSVGDCFVIMTPEETKAHYVASFGFEAEEDISKVMTAEQERMAIQGMNVRRERELLSDLRNGANNSNSREEDFADYVIGEIMGRSDELHDRYYVPINLATIREVSEKYQNQMKAVYEWETEHNVIDHELIAGEHDGVYGFSRDAIRSAMPDSRLANGEYVYEDIGIVAGRRIEARLHSQYNEINKDNVIVQSASHSHYKGMDIFTKDGQVFIGKELNYDNHGNYDNSDNSLQFVSDNEKMFSMLSGTGWVLSQQEMIDNGASTAEDYKEYATVREQLASQYEQEEEPLFEIDIEEKGSGVPFRYPDWTQEISSFYRFEASPRSIGEQGNYDAFVQRYEPTGNANAIPKEVVYIGTPRMAMEVANELNNPDSNRGELLKEDFALRSSLQEPVLQGGNISEDELQEDIYRLTDLRTERMERMVEAMREGGYEYDEIDSDSDRFAFNGEYGARMDFASIPEAEQWLDGVVFDNPEVGERVERIMHPERYNNERSTGMAEKDRETLLAERIIDFYEKYDSAFGYAEGVEGQENREQWIETIKGSLQEQSLYTHLLDLSRDNREAREEAISIYTSYPDITGYTPTENRYYEPELDLDGTAEELFIQARNGYIESPEALAKLQEILSSAVENKTEEAFYVGVLKEIAETEGTEYHPYAVAKKDILDDVNPEDISERDGLTVEIRKEQDNVLIAVSEFTEEREATGATAIPVEQFVNMTAQDISRTVNEVYAYNMVEQEREEDRERENFFEEVVIDGNRCNQIDTWESDNHTYVIGNSIDDTDFFYASVSGIEGDLIQGSAVFEYDRQPSREKVESDYIDLMAERDINAHEAEFGADGSRNFPHREETREQITLNIQYREPINVNGFSVERDRILFDSREELFKYINGESAYDYLDNAVRTNANERLLNAIDEYGVVVWSEEYGREIVPIQEFRNGNGRMIEGDRIAVEKSQREGHSDRSIVFHAVEDFENNNNIPQNQREIVDGSYVDKEFLYMGYDRYVGMSHRNDSSIEPYMDRINAFGKDDESFTNRMIAEVYYGQQNGVTAEQFDYIFDTVKDEQYPEGDFRILRNAYEFGLNQEQVELIAGATSYAKEYVSEFMLTGGKTEDAKALQNINDVSQYYVIGESLKKGNITRDVAEAIINGSGEMKANDTNRRFDFMAYEFFAEYLTDSAEKDSQITGAVITNTLHKFVEQTEVNNLKQFVEKSGGFPAFDPSREEKKETVVTMTEEEKTISEGVSLPSEKKDPKEQLQEQLQQGIKNVLDSDNFKSWLDTSSKLFLNNYSFNNAMLVYCQKPDATHTMGYEQWKEYGRNVAQGAKGIKIFVPIIAYEKKDGDLWKMIKGNLQKQMNENPSISQATYRVGLSKLEVTMNRNNLFGLKIDGKELGIRSENDMKNFIKNNVIGKVPMYFSIGTVFDAKDTVVPEYLWVKKGYKKEELVKDDKGKPIKNRKGEYKIVNTPERQARFNPHLDMSVPQKDPQKMAILYDALKAVSERNGIHVYEKDRAEDDTLKGGADGYFSRRFDAENPKGFIVMPKDLDPTRAVSVLLHEMSHSELHGNLEKLAQRMGEDNVPSHMREIQAESVAYVVGKNFGIDSDTSSFQYLASFSKGFELQALSKSIEVIYGECKQLTAELKSELEVRGLNMDLSERDAKPMDRETIDTLAKSYVTYAVEQDSRIADLEKDLTNIAEQNKDNGEALEVIVKQKESLDCQKEDVKVIKDAVTNMEQATTLEGQKKEIATIDTAVKRIEGAKETFATLTVELEKERQTEQGLKDRFTAEPLATLESMKESYPQLASLTSAQLQYVANSDYINRNFSSLLREEPQKFVDNVCQRATEIDKVTSKNGYFVEVNFCEQWTDKPIVNDGAIMHPKVADTIIKQGETQARGLKAKAEAVGEYFPYTKCSLSVFHAEKGNIDNVFKTRVDIGDGYQTSLVDHMKQISSASPILAGFEKATREQGAKEKIMFNSTHREEVVAEQTEKTGALSDRAMSREEWGNEIASAKQAEVNNSREDNEPQKNTRSKTEMEKG
jgi:hypothetical protein